MTTHELQAKNRAAFFAHISEVYSNISLLEKRITIAENDLARKDADGHWDEQPFWTTFPVLVKKAKHRLEIDKKTASRLDTWARKQIAIKLLNS